jgi:hypothetical protein
MWECGRDHGRSSITPGSAGFCRTGSVRQVQGSRGKPQLPQKSRSPVRASLGDASAAHSGDQLSLQDFSLETLHLPSVHFQASLGVLEHPDFLVLLGEVPKVCVGGCTFTEASVSHPDWCFGSCQPVYPNSKDREAATPGSGAMSWLILVIWTMLGVTDVGSQQVPPREDVDNRPSHLGSCCWGTMVPPRKFVANPPPGQIA